MTHFANTIEPPLTDPSRKQKLSHGRSHRETLRFQPPTSGFLSHAETSFAKGVIKELNHCLKLVPKALRSLFTTNQQAGIIFLQLTKHVSILIYRFRYSATVGSGLSSNQGGRVRRWLVHFTNNTCQQFLLNPNERQVQISSSSD